MTAFGKLFMFIAMFILGSIIVLGIAYIVYLRQGAQLVAYVMSHILM